MITHLLNEITMMIDHDLIQTRIFVGNLYCCNIYWKLKKIKTQKKLVKFFIIDKRGKTWQCSLLHLICLLKKNKCL